MAPIFTENATHSLDLFIMFWMYNLLLRFYFFFFFYLCWDFSGFFFHRSLSSNGARRRRQCHQSKQEHSLMFTTENVLFLINRGNYLIALKHLFRSPKEQIKKEKFFNWLRFHPFDINSFKGNYFQCTHTHYQNGLSSYSTGWRSGHDIIPWKQQKGK